MSLRPCLVQIGSSWLGNWKIFLTDFLASSFDFNPFVHAEANEIALQYRPALVTSFLRCPHPALLRIFPRLSIAPRKNTAAPLWPPRPRVAGPAYTSILSTSHGALSTLASLNPQNV